VENSRELDIKTFEVWYFYRPAHEDMDAVTG